ncbi:MAG: DUF4156 domain-containing protein [Neisseriaceae bacterium]|jgi:hypothetical protein|nr:MAG: DUF4156 domain-containing protein [Neisseriaceae bacterium]
MKKSMVHCVILISSLSLVACAAISVQPNAQDIQVINSQQEVPEGCKYLGQVSGSQGNFFTGTYTSNNNLAVGAMNDLKNKAADLGGNYIQLLTNQASTTGSGGLIGGGMQQTGVVNMGNVYSCKESAIAS